MKNHEKLSKTIKNMITHPKNFKSVCQNLSWARYQSQPAGCEFCPRGLLGPTARRPTAPPTAAPTAAPTARQLTAADRCGDRPAELVFLLVFDYLYYFEGPTGALETYKCFGGPKG